MSPAVQDLPAALPARDPLVVTPPTRAWVGVVSRAHVQRGVAGGFAQLCHGKGAPLRRMMPGDILVYYSPSTEMGGGAPLRAFTALGRIAPREPYSFDMGGGLVPDRRDVAYVRCEREPEARRLDLDFIRNNANWGMLARRGHFEISLRDLGVIAAAMGAPLRIGLASRPRQGPPRKPGAPGTRAPPPVGGSHSGNFVSWCRAPRLFLPHSRRGSLPWGGGVYWLFCRDFWRKWGHNVSHSPRHYLSHSEAMAVRRAVAIDGKKYGLSRSGQGGMGMAGEPRSLRLLIIEDCEADALLVLRELRRGGFEVTHSRVDTEDGLREALRQPWDVILSDYAMPCLSGQIALSVVRELAPLTPFVVLSGSIGEEAAVALLSAGASDYLLKDRTSRLCSAIDRALREADGLRRRREAEEALRRSEERFRTLVESMSESVFTTGLDARIDGVFGNWPADLVPARQAHRCQTVGELLGAEVVPRHEAAMRQAERGEQAIYECSLETAQGSRSLSVSLSPRRNERGEIAGFVGVGRDVTVQKHLESQLAVSDRLASLGMLASGVAHEINNPVSAVIINAEVLLDALLAPQGAQNHHDSIEIATMIRDAGERIAGVVKDLKLFSRAPDDRLSALDVRRVIDSSVRLVGNVHRSVARVAARYEDVAPVLGNEARLGQVFLNLISNAIESFLSHDRKNEVRIVCRRRGLDRLAIEVIDNGAGMPPDVVKQLFTPFFTTKEVGGTGLGLAICHRIITSHGGSIEVESTPGQGSIFRVLLPLAVPLAAPVERPQRREASGRRVLVVDDDRLVLESICRALHREHDTIGVTHAREALELIQSGEHFDLIVCDLAMPGGSGVDLHDQLRRLAPGLAEGMIFISGGGFHPEVDAFFSRTSNERIDKPFSPAALADLISRRLRAAESTDV